MFSGSFNYKERITPMYENPIDKPPQFPSAWDDEFNDKSIDTKWSWVNQGTATITEIDNIEILNIPANSSNSIRARVQTAPPVVFTLIGKILKGVSSNNTTAGLIFYNSNTGKLIFFGLQNSTVGTETSNVTARVHKYNSVTSYNSGPWSGDFTGDICYIKLKYDGTNIKAWFSSDGRIFTTNPQWSETLATFLTNITHIGFTGDSWGSKESAFGIDWFRVTAP